MKITKNGIKQIETYEGFRVKAYKCAAGVWTIGFGTTRWSNGNDVKQNETITREKAEKELLTYLERNVYPKLKEYTWLNSAQFDSMCSFVYNIGSISKNLHNALLSMNIAKVSKKMLEFTHVGGAVSRGLLNRRSEEIKPFASAIRVKEFQKLFKGLKVDGLCGPKTEACIPVLQKGMKSPVVGLIQSWLGLKVDNVYGNKTRDAVKLFQSRNGLIVDGIVGKNTMLYLFGY